MNKHTQKNFSHELRENKLTEKQLELVGHPVLRQVFTEILAEEQEDNAYGSSFGEGGP